MSNKLIVFLVVLLAVVAFVFVFLNREAIAPDYGNEPSISPTPQLNITIESPTANEKVSNPIVVKGKARVFENTFSYALRDRNGNKLYENFAMTDAPDAGIFGNYTVKIPVPASAPKNLVVEVFEYSAKDGSVINLVRVPVELASQEKASIKVNFSNSKLDPANTCTQTFPVTRQIYKTQEVAYVALSELISGPTPEDASSGYTTNINKGVRINSLRIENGTAYADFNETLEAEVAGSCRVMAIRAQIENTLKQFPTVKNVVISVNGRTQDVLQP